MKASQPSLAQAVIRWVLLLAGIFILASAALARNDELPGRVGRVVQVEGRASVYDQEQDRWVDALRNGALSSGDRLSTERGARLQVGVGSTELRLAGDTELIFDRLDDERMVLVVQHGSVAVRVRNPELAREVEILAGSSRARPSGVGHYRIDREGNTARMTVWRGSLQLDTGDQRLVVDTGRSVELFREWRDGTAVTWAPVAQDSFSDWVARDEQRDDRLAGNRYVSPEMTGAEELDRHGRWDRHPELGWVWLPLQVGVDWTPFRHGRWTWHARWGWTWLDDAPWGFATSHYGRWTHWGGRWVWAPGVYVSRPVFAPALVGWVGGSSPGFGVSVSIGSAPAVGWFPLSPFDVYVPPFRHAPRYYERVNQPHRRPGVPPQVPTGPISYGNNGVPNAVTVVPAAVMQQRQPVAPAVMRETDQRRWSGGGAQPGARVVNVPGGAVPVVPAAPGPLPQVMTSPGAVGAPVVPGGMGGNTQPAVTVRSQPVPAVAPPTMPPIAAPQPQVQTAPPIPSQVPTVAPQVVMPTMRTPPSEGRERPRHESQEVPRSQAFPVPGPVTAPMAPAARPPMAPAAGPMAPVAIPAPPARVEQPAQRTRPPEQPGRRDGREGFRERQERQ